MKYATKMVSGAMMPSYMMIGLGIQIILGSLAQQYETLQCW
jgi:hypothetical protein